MPVVFPNQINLPAVSDALRRKAFLSSLLQRQLEIDGVFEGGGALGTAYVGALRALHDNGIWFKRVAGNSAGSINAAMIAAGFTAPEIQWLSSAFAGPAIPQSLANAGITAPIAFSTFLDLPGINTISTASKRKTLLWNALKGTVLDEIGKRDVPVPTQPSAVNAVMAALGTVPVVGSALLDANVNAVARGALNAALAPLPGRQLKVRDFFWDTEALRVALADTLWDAIGTNSPMQLLLTNLIHEGSLFEGERFLTTIKKLLGLKVHNNENATVLFSDLTIPLAVIASDIRAGRMIVYSSRTHPNFEVAEAVRQSMSIPFVFEPRGNARHLVDGGLCSNFPLWLYSAGGDPFWVPAVIDARRVKVGFSLDDSGTAPAAWNVAPARFATAGNPPRVDDGEVLRPILVEKFVEVGVPRNVAQASVDAALTPQQPNVRPPVEIISEIVGVVTRGLMNTEESVRKMTTAGLMNGRPYVDVSIPVLGYHGLDFFINEDEAALLPMWDRGWKATMDALNQAKAARLLPPAMRLPHPQSPFD